MKKYGIRYQQKENAKHNRRTDKKYIILYLL